MDPRGAVPLPPSTVPAPWRADTGPGARGNDLPRCLPRGKVSESLTPSGPPDRPLCALRPPLGAPPGPSGLSASPHASPVWGRSAESLPVPSSARSVQGPSRGAVSPCEPSAKGRGAPGKAEPRGTRRPAASAAALSLRKGRPAGGPSPVTAQPRVPGHIPLRQAQVIPISLLNESAQPLPGKLKFFPKTLVSRDGELGCEGDVDLEILLCMTVTSALTHGGALCALRAETRVTGSGPRAFSVGLP